MNKRESADATRASSDDVACCSPQATSPQRDTDATNVVPGHWVARLTPSSMTSGQTHFGREHGSIATSPGTRFEPHRQRVPA